MEIEENGTIKKPFRVIYPKEMMHRCLICDHLVNFKYATGGKFVRCLDRDIYQIINLYQCTNEYCEMSKKVFNPAVRIDYSGSYFGADVFRFVAKHFLLIESKPKQILKLIQLDHTLSISLSTINRMCNDIMKIKAHAIDQRTLEIIKEQGYILLGLDGQDPGGGSPAIWCFMDHCTNRILYTKKFKKINHVALHQTIELIKNIFEVPIIGIISDKQGLIVKCHDVFYSDIPHQYCQYHFLQNNWGHIDKLDSNIFLPLKKAIKKLYIHSASESTTVFFEGIGKESVRTIFEPVEADLLKMIKARTKKFKKLRGVWLFEELTKYVAEMHLRGAELNPNYRLTKILKSTASALDNALKEVKPYYTDIIEVTRYFKEISECLGEEGLTKQERENRFDSIYDVIFSAIQRRKPDFELTSCKSFLPIKKTSTVDILGEFIRLGGSYRRGLFSYYNFPKFIKTNNHVETGFSKQKQAIINRVSKGIVRHMISTRGEDYLRLKHCEESELASDILENYSEELVRELRKELQADISYETSNWHCMTSLYDGISYLIVNSYSEVI